jgi:hypothetical protein
MTPEAVGRLVRRVLATQDAEPELREAEQALAPLADAMARGQDVSTTVAWLQPFLEQSPETEDVLLSLGEVARMDLGGGLPETAELLAQLRQTMPAGGPTRVGARAADHARPRAERAAVARHPSPLVTVATPAVLGVALAVAVGGWYRADRRADQSAALLAGLEAVLAQNPSVVPTANQGVPAVAPADQAGCSELASTVAAAHEARSHSEDSGDWSRVLFTPGDKLAAIWGGGPTVSASSGGLACWLVASNGARYKPRVVHQAAGGTQWWLVETDRDVADYDEMDLTSVTTGQTLVRVDLHP